MNMMFEPPAPARLDVLTRPAVHLDIDGVIRPAARRGERICTRLSLAAGILLLTWMLIGVAPLAYRYFTVTPAPRSLAPSAIANPQLAAVEAGRQPTGQSR